MTEIPFQYLIRERNPNIKKENKERSINNEIKYMYMKHGFRYVA